LEVMIISLRAGQSLDQTIRLTASELDAPIGDEFHRVSEEVQLGRPLEEALVAMSARLAAARTVRTFVTSVLVLRQTGGNLIEVLEQIIDTMRQQAQYERKLSAMTAEGRSSARMLAGLPPIFVLLAYMADSNYIGTLVNDPVGRVLLTVAIIMYTAGVVWTRRLTNPKT
ncbi:MAG: type II secretion system F family protein, partial [Myxococcales bacterium]|nr:type II secretion system F family protein [Myxococcales bacterium]